MDKYSFETFGRPKQTFDNYNPEAGPRRSDLLALQYSDYVAKLLEGRSTGARVTREVSDSTLAVGGAFLAATETLEIAAETVAGMGVGAVIIRELQKIFNAGGRSEAFSDAAYLIRQAQSEYRQYNPNPLPDRLTENGAILVSRVDAAVHAARKTLNGRMPGLLDLKQATQPMTKKGAERESSGTPQTMVNAAGDPPLPAPRPPPLPTPRPPKQSDDPTVEIMKEEAARRMTLDKEREKVFDALDKLTLDKKTPAFYATVMKDAPPSFSRDEAGVTRYLQKKETEVETVQDVGEAIKTWSGAHP